MQECLFINFYAGMRLATVNAAGCRLVVSELLGNKQPNKQKVVVHTAVACRLSHVAQLMLTMRQQLILMLLAIEQAREMDRHNGRRCRTVVHVQLRPAR